VELGEHFFRHESGRLVAALTRVFGIHRLALAEDVAQHAFCRALEVWRLHGLPQNPSAWLLSTAKNRVLDVLRRERTAARFAADVERSLTDRDVDDAFTPEAIRDEQLRMMFSCCSPSLPELAQVALILNVLCGFGAAEIGSALLTGQAAIEKRLSRGKSTLAGARSLFDLGDAEFASRLGTVRSALYLLFNEGYHGASTTAAIRPELCQESIRLTRLLCDHAPSATPTTHALLSLMCLNAARLPARLSAEGDLLPWSEQDRKAWDPRWIAEGLGHFDLSAAGEELSAFHLEAAIAVTHASDAQTDFARIVELYERLRQLAPSPVAALGRAIALAELHGPERGIEELLRIHDVERLLPYPFYHAALGELELRRGDAGAARSHYLAALERARSDLERRYLERRLALTSH
jgi:RNA polymerase sigma factor (sigma-70 family)